MRGKARSHRHAGPTGTGRGARRAVRTRQGWLAAGLVVALALLLAGCGSAGTKAAAGDSLRVVAAENFWGSIAAQLGGTKVDVTSIITNPNTDPHSYEPTAADAQHDRRRSRWSYSTASATIPGRRS